MKPVLIDTTLSLVSGGLGVQYDTRTGAQLSRAPRPIKTLWNMPLPGIDAAVNWGDGTVYFIHHMQVMRYDLARAAVRPGYPTVLPFYWRGLWASDIDAAVRLDRSAFFFRGDECLQYDIRAGQAGPEGPLPITDSWYGLPGRITGVVPLTDAYLLFFAGETCYVYDLNKDQTVTGPVPFADVIRDGIPAFLTRLSPSTEPFSPDDRY